MSVPAILETHMAIVGTTGAGKTVTGKGYVEQLLVDGRQVIVMDPTGAWWGMQSNAAGDGPGLRIPVFGGLHGNATLEAGDGTRVAELLVEQRVSAILDLSEMDEEEQRGFALAFIARMRTKPIGNLHLVIDEADEIAPELVPDSDAFKLKRALAWIAKRGRIRGFVLTIITQRPADIAKSVLALAQTMVIHRLIAPQDQAPIDRYLKSHATAATRKEVMGSLAGLQRGERWIYSPVEAVLERGRSPALTTFDSSAAPIAGQQASEPQALADVDFAALAEALAASRPEPDPIAGIEERDPGAWAALVARVDALEATIASGASGPSTAEPPAGLDLPPPLVEARNPPIDVAAFATAAKTPRGATIKVGAPSSAELNGIATAILVNLKTIAPAEVTWAQAAQMVGRSPLSGPFYAAKKQLAASPEVLSYDGRIRATKASGRGLDRAEAIAAWSKVVDGFAPRMLAVLQDDLMRSRDELAAAMGVSPKSGPWFGGLKQLRVRGLIEESGQQLKLARPLPGERP